MTELFLQKDGSQWQRVYFDTSAGSIKLTRENPYFTQSESYTLDITLPMDILENRSFLCNLQRIDCSKQPPVMKCRLVVDNVPVLNGSAKVVQVTEQQVKVQLLGGRSEVNFLSSENGDYIDQLPLGTREYVTEGLSFYTDISTGLPFSTSPVYNETAAKIVSPLCACHPQLVGVMRLVLAHYGYTLATSFLDEHPWDRIFIVSALHTLDIAHKLPHWTVRDFITEFCRFFNVSLFTDADHHTAAFLHNTTYFTQQSAVTIEPVDEYQADINEEPEASLASSTLAYDLSSSAGHDIDCFADEVRPALPRLSFATATELRNAWAAYSPEYRRRYLFCTPYLSYLSWVRTDPSDNDCEDLLLADMFAPRSRGDDADRLELKIVPVAITQDAVRQLTATTHKTAAGIPSLESPSPDEAPYPWEDQELFGELPPVQDYITGEADVDKSEKEDILQVMFDDGRTTYYANIADEQAYQASGVVGFTDYRLKPSTDGNQHAEWSMALADYPESPMVCVGDLHDNPYTFNMKAKLMVKFFSNRIPDPTRVYIIRNKRYGCEKIEANVNANGFDHLMTGYFDEMLE